MNNVYEFLAGYKDENGVIHTEFELKEITGVEEEAIAKKDVRENGGKLIRTLLERCITRVGEYTPKSLGQAKWRELIQNLIVGDQDYALLKLRELTMGEEIEMKHDCPHCKEKLTTVVELGELDIKPFLGERELEFELPKGYTDKDGVVHTTGKIRFPNGLDREILDTVARKNLGTANTMLLTRCVSELGTAKITDNTLRSLSIRDREYLLKVLQENNFGVNLYIDLTCSSCGEEFKSTLNMVNFL